MLRDGGAMPTLVADERHSPHHHLTIARIAPQTNRSGEQVHIRIAIALNQNHCLWFSQEKQVCIASNFNHHHFQALL